jgi:hypothetical protein
MDSWKDLLSIRKGLEFNWKGFSYTIGYALYAFAFFISFVIPPLKAVTSEYATKGTQKSAMIIGLIGTTPLVGIYMWIAYGSMPPSLVEWTKSLGLFIVWFVLGYLALYSLGNYRKGGGWEGR